VCALHAYKARIVSSVRRFSFLGNRGIWSKRRKNALLGGARQATRCLSTLRGCINLLLSTWSATPSQRILYYPTYFHSYVDRQNIRKSTVLVENLEYINWRIFIKNEYSFSLCRIVLMSQL